ncbi:MAG: hypothetical protein J0I77_11220 [Rudaea sp.]|uniref:hypothetical protein n=1 Tax=unclassified Rudaea TaxID=2627037 RepID=UPI0010F89D78|nr:MULTISPECIES: hypothetical protein [unclassified Rudaea]MBN8886284.1 hypothetical protein [Rudaea sp.]
MDDHSTIGHVVDEMYAMISGPAGPRDWARQKKIFHPQARQIRMTIDEHGAPKSKIMGLTEYEQDVAPIFEKLAFFELEKKRRIDIMGNMAHVWSLYEARRDPADPIPERRGINSIQLMKESDGSWWIISMIWDNEREGVVAALF